MELFRSTPAKNVNGVQVSLNYGFESAISVDMRAGRFQKKVTGILINGESMCSTSGFVSHEQAYEIAKQAMQGTKWEF